MAVPTPNSIQLQRTLKEFYEKPIARVSLELVFTVVTITALALIAIRPTLLTVSELIREIDQKTALDNALAQKVAALGSAQVQYTAIESRLGVLDEALPSVPQFSQVLEVVEALASQAGVRLTENVAQEVPKEITVDPVDFAQASRQAKPIIVTIVGPYANIRQFIELLLQLRRTFIIDSVVFKNTEVSGVSQISAVLTISAPYFGPAEATHSATPVPASTGSTASSSGVTP